MQRHPIKHFCLSLLPSPLLRGLYHMKKRDFDESLFRPAKYQHFFYKNISDLEQTALASKSCLKVYGVDRLSIFNVWVLLTVLSDSLSSIYQGFVPVPSNAFKDGNNIWDTFFEPILPTFELRQAGELGDQDHKRTMSFMTDESLRKRDIRFIHFLITRYLRLNATTKEYVLKEEERLGFDSKKTLGVLIRGTDYIKLKPKNHPRQPSFEEVVRTTRKVIKRFGYTSIYLATEDEDIANRFKKEFPGMILENKRHYLDKAFAKEKALLLRDVTLGISNEEEVLGLEYLTSLVLLSKCDSLVAGQCGGSVFARYLNGLEYRCCRIFNKGRYHGFDILKHDYESK